MAVHLLAIETATEACSVALVSGETIVARHELAPRRHAELVLPMIEGVLAEAGLSRSALDAIAVGRGPGAFTGVRLAISVAQGLALGLDRPVVPVSTLAALALEAQVEAGDDSGAGNTPNAAPREPILAAIDARMGEVYYAAYDADDDGLVTAIGAENVCEAPRCRATIGASYIAAGTAWGAYGVALETAFGRAPRIVLPALLPRATSVARLALRELAAGRVVDAAHAQPVYLRDKVALTVAEQAAARKPG